MSKTLDKSVVDRTKILDLPYVSSGQTSLAPLGNPDASAWPINPEDVTPLEWWRTLPSDHMNDARHLVLSTTLDKICALQGGESALAMHGDAAASIAIAIEAAPFTSITLAVDLAMSTLLVNALGGSAASALVLSHILRQTRLDHPFARELSVSWLLFNLRQAAVGKKHIEKPAAAKSSEIIKRDYAGALS